MPNSRSSLSNAPIPEKIEAVVFDFDGTIYDNKDLPFHLIKCNLTRLLTLQSERSARKAIKSIDFGTREAVYKALFERMAAFCWSKDVAKYERWFHGTYVPQMTAILALYYEPRPLFQELVEALHAQGIKVFVYSDYEAVAEKLTALQIDAKLFDGLLDAAQTGGLKPCKEAFGRMLECFGCEASTSLMVGDRDDTDGEGARSVGMPFYNVKASHDAWDELLKHFL